MGPWYWTIQVKSSAWHVITQSLHYHNHELNHSLITPSLSLTQSLHYHSLSLNHSLITPSLSLSLTQSLHYHSLSQIANFLHLCYHCHSVIPISEPLTESLNNYIYYHCYSVTPLSQPLTASLTYYNLTITITQSLHYHCITNFLQLHNHCHSFSHSTITATH